MSEAEQDQHDTDEEIKEWVKANHPHNGRPTVTVSVVQGNLSAKRTVVVENHILANGKLGNDFKAAVKVAQTGARKVLFELRDALTEIYQEQS